MKETYSEFRKTQQDYAKKHNYGFGIIKNATFESAIFIAYYLRNTFITANIITTLNLLLWLILPFLFLKGTISLAIWSIVLMILTNYLDFIDGVFARVQGTQSRGGGYFDSFVHAVTLPIIMTCFGYYSYLQSGHFYDIFTGLAIGLWYPYFFLFESMAVFVLVHNPKPIKYKMDNLSVKTKSNKSSPLNLIKRIISRIYGPPELFWVLLVVVLLGITHYYLLIFSIIAVLSVLYKFYNNYKHLRKIR
ncbi:hypothetical protein AUJ84_02140 [Candidatus Pacearchaeota archaeon CG1_02_32_132]|nr:MAG: hypothetical protein AUJ84_02140 [Candidatus Pacearchaeota archaeon CG1_02_32_132]